MSDRVIQAQTGPSHTVEVHEVSYVFHSVGR